MKEPKRIAIYGKGGIGKSSTASNIAAACADEGHRVMIIGCDPKSDSSITLLGGRRIPTILNLMRSGLDVTEEDVVFEGYNGARDRMCRAWHHCGDTKTQEDLKRAGEG